MAPSLSPGSVAAAAQLACLLEASAPKPGNVSPGRDFADLRYEDFLAAAAAIGGPVAGAGGRPLGATIRLAIDATRRWTASNTNLGIVLLLTPIARAACLDHAPADPEADDRVPRAALRSRLHRVLADTTVEDAREVYAAIRQAAPGGLGRVDRQDVADEPTVTLIDAMRMAADRDGVAREYATTFDMTFGTGEPALRRARADDLPWEAAIVEAFLTMLAAAPDTHIARRGGEARAADVRARAEGVMAAGGVRSDEGRRAIAELDRRLRGDRHLANPGTTADLTAAAIFVVLLTGGWTGADPSVEVLHDTTR